MKISSRHAVVMLVKYLIYIDLFCALNPGKRAYGDEKLRISCDKYDHTIENIHTRELREGTDAEQLTRWFEPQSKIKGVALIVHGLNNKPAVMNDLAFLFAENGILGLRTSLRGHSGNLEAMKNVDAMQWRKDFFQSYCVAHMSAQENNAPLYLMGYSLGALTALNVLVSPKFEKPHFDHLFMIAPPISLRFFVYLLKLFNPFKSLVIPSANIESYRATSGTSVAAYDALHSLQSELVEFANIQSFNESKATIFIHNDDELVSVSGIEKFILENKIKDWKLIKLTNNDFTGEKKINHLIVDEKSLGMKSWTILKNQIRLDIQNIVSLKKVTP